MQSLLVEAGAQFAPAATGHSTTVSILIIVVLSILAVAVLLFLGLVVLRIIGSRREKRLLAKKELLNPLVNELLTGDSSTEEVVKALVSKVPRRDRKALEQVLLENIRFLKGQEQELLTGVFDTMGYVDEDIAGLGRGGMVRQAESAYHLGTMRCQRAIPALAKALESSRHPEVVFSCLNALSKIGTTEALELVIDYLALSPELETLRVAEVILERRQEFSRYIEQWLDRGEPDVGRLILLVNLLGAMKEAHAVPMLVSLLEHDDPGVRARVAFSLGNIGDFTVCDQLVEAMGDGAGEVRAESAEALGKLQCETAIPRLRLGLADDDLSVRMGCAMALSQMGEEGRAVLEEVLLTTGETQREVAAEALTTLDVREQE